jgi:hypothetical protein
MKKTLFTLIAVLMVATSSFAQLTGVKTVPGDYATFAAAITALNTSGVGTGGVIFNVAAGYTENFASPTAGHITTLTGSASSPIIFQKSGSGNNPLITGGIGVAYLDAIIAIAGCDYITFDGIDLRDRPQNVTVGPMMEWGYAILKNSTTDGSQNIIIKNCTITLKKVHDRTTGIYSNNHTIASPTQLAISAFSGTNSNLKIYNNTFTNCYSGIYLKGYNHPSAPYNFYDQNNEIGKDGGNIITNVAGQTEAGYGIYTMYQNNLIVANNNITSTMGGLAGTAVPYGIFLNTALNGSFDLYNNYVSMQYSGDQYSDFYAIYGEMGGSGTSNIVNIYNNTVTGCTYPTAQNGWIYYFKFINLGVTTNIYGNVVSNNTLGSTSLAAIGRIDYMWFNKSNDTQGPMEVYNNSVTGNTRFSNFVVGQPMAYLAVGGNGTTLDCYDNLIDNNITNSDHAIQGLYILYNDSEYKKVHHNTITNITEIRGSATGLYNYHGTLGYFYNNKIQNLKGKSSSPNASIFGIYQTEYGKEMYFFNNTVTDLENPGAEVNLGTDWNKLSGIYIENSVNIRGFYYNTVYLNAPITGNQTNYGSSALCGMTLYGVDLRNNILINTSASKGPEGKTVVIRERQPYPGGTNYTSNYNNLYAGTPGPKNLIFYDGVSAMQTLNDYKTLQFPQEIQSVTELSPFVNTTTQPWDVHLQTNVPNQCEAGGTLVNVPFPIITDFDGNPRYPNPGYPINPSFSPKAPDIGAFEFGGLYNDITPPAIIYTPLLNTYQNSERILLADLTDGTGFPTIGTGKPCLYWKINNGAYQLSQGQYVGGATFSFTFGDGVNLGDVVSYYVVAQDVVVPANVGAYPSVGASGFTSNPPACSTPPTIPSTYTIIQAISGTFHVGVGKPYTTLTAAVNDLNSKGVSGPVTFILDDNSYPNETFPIIFEPNAGSSSVNTVTIRANTGAYPVISGSIAWPGILMCEGMDYLTIDGSDGLTTERRLTIENSSPGGNSYTIGITNDGNSDPSTNITLKNCIVLGNNSDVLVETYLIVFNTNAGPYGGGYDNILIENNWIKRAKYGLYVSATQSNRNHDIIISNNMIGSPLASDYITRYGIAVEQSDNTLITGNDIMGPATQVGSYALFGIIYFNYSTNTKITKNKIHDWISSGPGSWGIKCQNDDPTTFTEISNNLMYNIGAYGLNPGVSATMAAGIWVHHGGNMRIWNNTILLTGDWLYGGDSYAPSSACIAFWNNSPVNSNQIDIRNNILQNSMTNSYPNPGPLAWGKAYGIMFTNAVTFSVLDNNDYYIDGYQGQIAQKFCVGGTCLINYPTLASWQAYTGMEANSITVNPQFTSSTNLIPTTTLMNNKGVYMPSVPTDYTGKIRSNPCDMGAYEFAVDQVFNLKVYLEGPYNSSTNTMGTDLLSGGYLPTSQPYNPALPYYGNNAPKWLYAGAESVTTLPEGAVDWVIVQLRDAASAGTAGNSTIIPGGTRAAFLMSDGTLRGVEGTSDNLIFAGVPITQNMFVVIYHRNHLGIISANAVTQSGSVYSYDYTTGSNKVLGGTLGYKQIDTSPVVWGMVGADGNGDGTIQNSDVTDAWKIDAGKKGYSGADYNLNVQISNQDKNDFWSPNLSKSSQVPQ